jgi:hypothetical protein
MSRLILCLGQETFTLEVKQIEKMKKVSGGIGIII